jgi:hypothetical protein
MRKVTIMMGLSLLVYLGMRVPALKAQENLNVTGNVTVTVSGNITARLVSEREAAVHSFRRMALSALKDNNRHSGRKRARVAEYQGEWRKYYSEIYDYHWDVKVTDSLVSPYIGTESELSEVHLTAPHPTKAEAQKDDNFVNVNGPTLVTTTWTYSDGRWNFVSVKP